MQPKYLNIFNNFDNLIFYTKDPGAFHAHRILKTKLANKNIITFADGFAANSLTKNSFINYNFQDIIKYNNINNLIILGSQTNYQATYDILKYFKKTQAKTMFVFDHWKNYLNHFTNDLTAPLILADFILVPDLKSKKNLENLIENPQKSQIVIAEHFYLEEFLAELSMLPKTHDNIIIFLDPDPTINVNLAKMHKHIISNNLEKNNIIIAPHPRQDLVKLNECLQNWNNINYKINSKLSNLELMASASEVWGIDSIMLVIALKAKITVLNFT